MAQSYRRGERSEPRGPPAGRQARVRPDPRPAGALRPSGATLRWRGRQPEPAERDDRDVAGSREIHTTRERSAATEPHGARPQ